MKTKQTFNLETLLHGWWVRAIAIQELWRIVKRTSAHSERVNNKNRKNEPTMK